MKWTKKRVLFIVLQLVCWLVAPVVFVILQYSGIKNTPQSIGFKVGITGIMLALVILILFKRVFINRYTKKLAMKIATFETQIETEIDQAKIVTIEHAIKKAKTIESLFSFILPFAMLCSAIYVCWALENAVVKLMGVFGFITISYALGEIFALCEISAIKSKHRIRED